MEPENFDEDIHHFDVVTGQLYKSVEKVWVGHSDYCIDVYDDGDTEMLTTFVCFGEVEEEADWWKPALFLISTICLALTLIIFFILPLVT
jgi:hypothetical protein